MKDNLLTEFKKGCVGVCLTGFDWGNNRRNRIPSADWHHLHRPTRRGPPRDFFTKGSKRRVYENFMTACFTRFGVCEAICDNIQEALPEKFYEQLEDEVMGYKEVTIMDYFDHLDDRRCKIDTKMRKQMRKVFYEP